MHYIIYAYTLVKSHQKKLTQPIKWFRMLHGSKYSKSLVRQASEKA